MAKQTQKMLDQRWKDREDERLMKMRDKEDRKRKMASYKDKGGRDNG